MKPSYDPKNKHSIISFAKLLKGKTLREVCGVAILTHGYSGKGNFGQVLEKYYFKYNPNSDKEPDFPEAGLELKSTPLKQIKNKEFRSKERLVLSMIDYWEIVKQNFDTSSFWKKNANILLVIYLYVQGDDLLDYEIKLVDEWNFPDTDLEIIKKDWELIRGKVADGRAHELSEGDTFYLGACTKGANANSTRTQPASKIRAKKRAFSLKQGYVNHIIASIAKETPGVYGKLIKSPAEARSKSIEEVVISKFKRYYGMTVEQILKKTKVKINPSAKNFYANLTKAILDVESDKAIEEFEKADITIRTVRLKENNLPKEDISFPPFEYKDLIKEEWDESAFKNILEHKFLFVFFQFNHGKLFLKKVKFWNMSFADREEAKKVWDEVRRIVATGSIVKEVRNGVRRTNFPNKKFNSISHVRPHALNSQDTYPLPVRDKVTKALKYTKHSFWLNGSYIRDEIYMK
jgi:DNA mismatch repair protein MutH